METVIKIESVSKKYILGNYVFNRNRTISEGFRSGFLNFKSKFYDSNNKKGFIDKKTFYALSDISFNIYENEKIGIIGRNGAGKSTLLKILSRITEPSQGHIEINGRVTSLLEIGTGFSHELSGRENIYLNGAILGMSKLEIKSKFDKIVEFAGIKIFIDTPVKRYSSGMYVRLAFSIAAHLESEILLIDEVLAVGDSAFQKQCLDKMNSLSTAGRTILFVSHNMAAIQKLCDRVIVLDFGKVVYDGKTSDAIDFYIHNNTKYIDNHSLLERKDRKGTGRIKASSINILNSEGKEVTELLSGESYCFKVWFKKFTLEDIDNVIFSIDIYDEREHFLLHFRSNFFNVFFNIHSETGYILCKVDDFPLTIGKYLICLYITQSDTELLDNLSHVMYFDVIGGDFYKTGSQGSPANCKFLYKANWEQF